MDPIQTQNPQQNDVNTVVPATPAEGANPFDLVKDGEQTVPTPEVAKTQPAQPAQPAAPAKPEGGGKFMKWLVSTIAKLMGQPDPFTGAQNAPAQPVNTPTQNIEGQPTPEAKPQGVLGWMWGIGWVFSGIADTAKGMVGEAVAWVKEAWQAVVPPVATPAAEAKPATPAPEAKPATPVVEAKPATPVAEAKPATPVAEAKPATPAPEVKPEAEVKKEETTPPTQG